MGAGSELNHGLGRVSEGAYGEGAREPDSFCADSRVDERTDDTGPRGGGALLAPSGIVCLSVVARRHQISADPVQLTQALGFELTTSVTKITNAQTLFAAKERGLKTKAMGREAQVSR